MDKIYYLCEFYYGGKGTFYLEAESGIVLRLVNMDGTTLVLEEPYGYNMIDKEGYPNLTFPQTI